MMDLNGCHGVCLWHVEITGTLGDPTVDRWPPLVKTTVIVQADSLNEAISAIEDSHLHRGNWAEVGGIPVISKIEMLGPSLICISDDDYAILPRSGFIQAPS